jgi:hypothetical protein
MKDNFLQQFIRGPTHIAGNKLDFLLSNSPEIIDNISTFTPVESKFPSDHYLVNFSLRLKFKRAMSVKRKSYKEFLRNFHWGGKTGKKAERKKMSRRGLANARI